MKLLEAEGLKVHFPVGRRWPGQPQALLRAVEDASFELGAAETLGLVGESGCGKSTLGRAVARLLPLTAGRLRFAGEDLGRLEGVALRTMRRQLQMIFQDPYNSLSPRLTVEQIIGEALDIHRLVPTRAARRERVAALLRGVGLPEDCLHRYPHEFSGGQRQRIGIARALAVEPRLIIADEPVSALDVSVQAQIVNLLQDLQVERRLAFLFIAHDLAVVEQISHRIMVMYLGRIVESAPAQALLAEPKHPYTQALISAVPTLDPDTQRARLVLPGDPPSPIHPPSGCPFHPRCPKVQPECRVRLPLLRESAPTHAVACHLA